MATSKLLIVEDDVALQKLLTLAFRRYRIGVDVVGLAEDALMMLAAFDYTGLITDLALPGMDGWTLLERVQRHPHTAELWCVAVTAHHDEAVETTALEAGFIAYFHKPLDVNRMVRQIADRLNESMVEARTAL